MILVAATAVAFVVLRPLTTGRLQEYPRLASYLAVAIGLLVTWTPTVLILRLRRPRPVFRRLARQPGFAASLAGTAILAVCALSIGLLGLIRVARSGMAVRAGMPRPIPDLWWWIGVVTHYGAVIGPAVIGAWLTLALSGRRRPMKGWLDGFGRAIGIAWIVLFVINCCVRLNSYRS